MVARGTKIRGVRMDDARWAELARLAELRGTDRTEVLLAALEHCKDLKTFARPPVGAK